MLGAYGHFQTVEAFTYQPIYLVKQFYTLPAAGLSLTRSKTNDFVAYSKIFAE